MGDQISTEKGAFSDKIQLFSQTEDPKLGKIDIYRGKQPPYDYVLDHKKTYIQDKNRLAKDLSLFHQLKNIEHPNLAKFFAVEMREDAQLCVKQQILHIYTNYYNFTLAQACLKKKLTKHVFSQGDLSYIAKALVDLSVQLQKYGLAKSNYRADEIYLSPEGYIKQYLLDVDEENRHSCYYTVLSQKERLPEFLLAPEQLQSLKKLELETKFDQHKADLFAIGLLLVELITLDRASNYYNYDLLEVMTAKIGFVLDTYASKRYSPEFINIVKMFLQPDPSKRISLETANQNLAYLIAQQKPKVHCIRLQADQNQQVQKAPQTAKIRKIGPGNLGTKLTPKPISMLSSTSSSRPITTTHTSIRKLPYQP